MKPALLLLLVAVPLQAQSPRTPPPSRVWAAQTELRSITLVWKRTSGAEGYRVYRVGSTPARGIPTGQLSKTVDRVTIALVPSYSGSYSYQVAAVYPGGALSRRISSNTVVPVRSRPPAASPPGSVTASETASGVITLKWGAVPGATGYFIGRAVQPGGFKTLCDVCSTETRYVDRKITAGAQHIYTVAALTPTGATKRTQSNVVTPSGSGNGEDDQGGGLADSTATDSSATDSATTVADTLVPRGVAAFTAANGVAGHVRLIWSPDPRASRYLIAFVDTVDDAHYTPAELFTERTIYSGTDTAAMITAPGDPTRTNYVIVSENSHGRSEPRYATPGATGRVAADQPPEGVTNLTAELPAATGHLSNFALHWTADPRAERYSISLSANGGPSQLVANLPGSFTSTQMSPRPPEQPVTSYTFSIVSENSKGKSPPRFSNPITGAPPKGPSTLTADPGPEAGTVKLTWQDLDAAGYQISRSVDGGSFQPVVMGQAANDRGEFFVSFIDRPPADGAVLKYRITTSNWFGHSPEVFSAPFNRLQAQAPAGVTGAVATILPDRRISLHWTADPNAANYQIKKSVDGGRTFLELTKLPGDRTGYADVAARFGATPIYQIVSINQYGLTSPPVTFEQETVEIDRGLPPPKAP